MTRGSCSAESRLVDVNCRGLKAPPTKGPDEWLVSPLRTNSAKTTDADIPRSASMPLLEKKLSQSEKGKHVSVGRCRENVDTG